MYKLDYKIPKYLDKCCSELLPSFIEYLENVKDINVTPKRHILAKRAFQCFLNNAASSVHLGKREVGIVLRESAYSNPLIFNGITINRKVSYTYTKHLLDYMVDVHGCELRVGGVDKWETDKLKLFTTGEFKVIPSEVTPSRVTLTYGLCNYISMFIRGKKFTLRHSVVEVRDSDGVPISKRMTDKQKSSITLLDEYNEKVRENKFTLYNKVMDFYVKKVYNHGSFEIGGRNYVMGLNARDILDKENRLFIHINGEQCMELDYSALCPRMLADLVGVKLDKDYDPYIIDLEGYDYDALRTACKVGVMCIINTDNLAKATLALSTEFMKGDWKELIEDYEKKGLWKKGTLAHTIIQALWDKNKHFLQYKDKYGAGVLMNIESQINDIIMERILADDQILLPVHDSFVVPQSYADQCEKVMYEAYNTVVGGSNCVVRKIIAHY